MPVKITKKQPTGKVEIQKPKQAAIHTEVPMGKMVAETPDMCNVGVQLGATKKIGEFDYFKFSVTLHKPCIEEEIDSTFAEIKAWVDAKAEEIMLESESN